MRETRLHPASSWRPCSFAPAPASGSRSRRCRAQHRLSPDDAPRGRAAGRARRRRRAAVRPARGQGRAGTGAWAEDGIVQQALRALRDADLPLVPHRRHLPVRVHLARPLRTAGRRRHASTTTRRWSCSPDRRRPGAGRRGHRRAQRDDGRPGRRHPGRARCGGPRGDRDHGLRRQDRIRVLRSVPGGGGQRARVGRPTRLPDGSANGREARRETALDVAEGADILLVKPALPQLDIVAATRAALRPAGRGVSRVGEYAMVARGRRARLDRRPRGDDRVGHGHRPCRGRTSSSPTPPRTSPAWLAEDRPMSRRRLCTSTCWRWASIAMAPPDRRRARRRLALVPRRPRRTAIGGVTSALLVDRDSSRAWTSCCGGPRRRGRRWSWRGGAAAIRPGWLADRHPRVPGPQRPVAVRRASRRRRSRAVTGDRVARTWSCTRSPSRPTGTSLPRGAAGRHERAHAGRPSSIRCVRQALAYSFGLDDQDFVVVVRDRRPGRVR